MSDSITIERLEKNLELFEKMYDAVRLVDPVKKVVLEYRGRERTETEAVCHDYWKNGKICDNCISIRAHLGSKCFMKLEQSDSAIMMVTALPMENTKDPTVLELLKNASDTMLLGHGEYSEGRMLSTAWMELNDIVVKDDLTGLYNRRFINERLPADILKTVLEGESLSVLFADVDNLKQINDTYGHSVGDLVLTRVARALQECIRSNNDWAARYGGDEFVICLNNTNESSANHIIERIYGRIADIKVSADHRTTITASLSLGAYTMRDNALTANEIIGLADQRMYAQKQKEGTANP